jgi:hypothetical protein
MNLTPELEDKIRSDVYDSDPFDVGRQLLGPMWRPGDKISTPPAVDLIGFLAPALADVLAYDGTRGNTARGRQSGFWERVEIGLEPIEIGDALTAVDRVYRPTLADAVTALDTRRRTRKLSDYEEKRQPDTVRVELIEALRHGLTSVGNYRGQLVAAIRDHGAFDFSKDDYLALVADCPPWALVQFAGVVRSIKAP